MKEFIIENWQFLVSAGLGFISVVIVLIKRAKIKVQDNSLYEVLDMIPLYIQYVEKIYPSGNGSLKKSLVADLIKEFCKVKKIGFDSYDFGTYIEQVLSCPQKKGE